MAAEGTRYTQAYCGTALMIGQHTGHSPVRANVEIIHCDAEIPFKSRVLGIAGGTGAGISEAGEAGI